jgi:hypothetical protein
MKIQLDTTNKIIKIEGSVNIEALYETLQKLLPKGEWKQFSLEANTSIDWISPITIPYYPYYPPTPYPWWGTPTYMSNNTSMAGMTQSEIMAESYNLKEGTYCIEI